MEKLLGFLIVCFVALGMYFSVQTSENLKSLQERLDRQSTEYQLVVEDDSIIVFDKERLVGKVKLQGQLDSLLIDDNQ